MTQPENDRVARLVSAAKRIGAPPEMLQGLQQAAQANPDAAAKAMLEFLEEQRTPHPLEAEGWRYIDPPTKFSPEYWELFLSYFGGPEHYKVLAFSEGVLGGLPFARGQLLVSPQGMANMQARAAASRAERGA